MRRDTINPYIRRVCEVCGDIRTKEADGHYIRDLLALLDKKAYGRPKNRGHLIFLCHV